MIRTVFIFLMCFLCIYNSNGDRIVLKADVVRDFPNMCYDVKNCLPRLVNDSWSTGACAMARCELHESGMLLEVHYTCPRIPSGLNKCEMIEDRRQPFPACCPRIICAKSHGFIHYGGGGGGGEKKVKSDQSFLGNQAINDAGGLYTSPPIKVSYNKTEVN